MSHRYLKHGLVEMCSSCGPNLVFTSMEFKNVIPHHKQCFIGADICPECSELGEGNLVSGTDVLASIL